MPELRGVCVPAKSATPLEHEQLGGIDALGLACLGQLHVSRHPGIDGVEDVSSHLGQLRSSLSGGQHGVGHREVEPVCVPSTDSSSSADLGALLAAGGGLGIGAKVHVFRPRLLALLIAFLAAFT